MLLTSKTNRLAGLLATCALTGSLCAWSQTRCPLEITAVDAAVPSAIGTGTSLRISYRNTTDVRIAVSVFQVRFGIGSRLVTFTEHQPLDPKSSDSAQWGAAAWSSLVTARAVRNIQVEVWPAAVAYSDGTRWTGNGQCQFHAGQAEMAMPESDPGDNAKKAASSTLSGEATGDARTAQSKLALVKAGKASLCNINSNPTGAYVGVDGRLVGVTPLSVVVLKKDTPREVYVYMEGRRLARRLVDPNGQACQISVTLEPLNGE